MVRIGSCNNTLALLACKCTWFASKITPHGRCASKVTLHGCVRRKQLGTAVRVEKASHTTIRKSRGAGCDLSASVSDAARRFSCSGRRFFGRVSCGVVSQLRNRRRVVFSAAIGFASIFSPHGARCVYFCP
ncbi:hypothetical protein NDU88_005382 [Pleurodeles waltl]|uniref:Uncharacterized protein n=1 Tax=Pleurodeles waltl TaxID=8319 RepID=A0AAV7X115_PLEWA|nr:hypothetical protein NDU88_005382 [Pleurodeles waltl]